MKQKRYIMAGLLGIALSSPAAAEGFKTKSSYDYANATQLWKGSTTAAGITRDSISEQGVTYFKLYRTEGSHRRVQEGDAVNQLTFFSESYKKIGKYLYGYGKVEFDMSRQFNRAWSDVYRSYNANPYISGSNIPGKYDNQDFRLSASVASIDLGGFTYGCLLEYNVGDLSRLKDPRSRTNLAEYKIAPSITFHLNGHIFGGSAFYHRRKEKIPSITTVQTDPNLKYYQMTGMEHAEGGTGIYNAFERQFVHHEFGGEISYSYQYGQYRTLNTVGLKRGHENVNGDMMYSPGKLFTSFYHFQSAHLFHTSSKIHRFELAGSLQQDYADEYRQEKVTEKNPETGIESSRWETLLTYHKRYKIEVLNLSAGYRMYWKKTPSSHEVKGYVGGKVQYEQASNKFSLPDSELGYRFMDASIDGGYGWEFRKHRSLWLEGKFGYLMTFKTNLTLSDTSTDYAQQVLIPDMKYYSSSVFHADLAVQYNFFLKGRKLLIPLFARAEGGIQKTNRSTFNKGFGVAVGIYY